MQIFINRFKIIKTRFILLLLLFFSSNVSCQRQLSPQAIKAIDLFDANQYVQSLPQFKTLLEKFPKDPLYQFYYGACLVETGNNPDDAVYYLKSATTKNAHPKAGYYLAKAFYFQFKFTEAENTYKEFINSSRKHNIKKLDVNSELKRVENAKSFFDLGYDFDILSKLNISEDSIKFVLSDWFENKPLITGIPKDAHVFTLKGSSKGQLFFSAQSKNDGSTDIYRIVFDKNGDPGIIESLDIVNTEYDEDYPVFIESENTLYFASKGRNSVGGYDIFYAKLANGKWTEPVQLPYPINTPWDDFMFFKAKNNQFFISNRRELKPRVSLFQIMPYETSNILDLSETEQILAMLDKKPMTVKKFNPNNQLTTEKAKDTEPIQFLSTGERQLYISKALQFQKTADSLLYLSRALKTDLNNTDDKDKRNAFFRNMSNFEKKSAEYQEKANDFYKKILGSSTLAAIVSDTDKQKAKKPETVFFHDKKMPYSKEKPIPFDETLPQGIIYRIQLGAFSKSPDYERFGGLYPLSGESLQDGKILKYYVGIFHQYDTAENALRKVKGVGFKEAFIVSYFDNKKIPVERAKEMEKDN